jgi:hypothetical protein
MQAIIGGLVAFAVVVGWALVRWRASGRDPTYLDDPSILLPAPPEGMTAATATVVDAGPAATAFMAALFDLASRDEIAFRDETPDARGTHHVGIELRGGHTDDDRVLLNRRRPVGEGEAWLLANLKSYAVMRTGATGGDPREVAAIAAMSSFSGFLANALAAGGSEAGAGAAPAAPSDPLNPAAPADLQTAVIAALERSGRPVPESMRTSAARTAPMMGLLHEALSDPAAVEADPQAFAKRIEAVTGHTPTPEEMESGLAWLREHTAGTRQTGTTAAGATAPTYISADRASMFHAPIGFATFVESYARRKGWIKGFSFIARWKWEGLAVAEVVVGLLVAGVDSTGLGLLYGVGLGIAAGGVVTWFVARYMASRTREGAVMKAQLAAYRRTLKATFDSSPTLDDVVTASKMTWLETPDQALVWGVALGLRPEIEAILARTTHGMSAGTVPVSAFLPHWIGQATRRVSEAASQLAADAAAQLAAGAGHAASTTPSGAIAAKATTGLASNASNDYASVFAGIERIGTVTPPQSSGS